MVGVDYWEGGGCGLLDGGDVVGVDYWKVERW